jgi:hypothetical protein
MICLFAGMLLSVASSWPLFVAGLVAVALIAASEPWLAVILASLLAAGLVSAAAIALSHRAP